MSLTAPIKIFSGRESKYVAENIAKKLGKPLGKVTVEKFSDGEIQAFYDETVRGAHVFIIQSTFQPSENLFELLQLIDAAKRASAYKIVAVMPYFGYARQDRKDKPRVSIGSKLVADMLTTAGVSRIMTMDLHADQIQGFFNVPVDHLYASAIFIPYIKQMNLDNLTIAAPDMGGSKRAHAYASYLDAPVVISHKHRSKANEIGSMRIIGDVKDKNVIIVDDIVDTAGTITKAAEIMMNEGAKSVRVMITHPVLSGPAYERIENSAIKELIVTDTIPLKHTSDKITVLPVADLFAETITNVYNQRSISETFIF